MKLLGTWADVLKLIFRSKSDGKAVTLEIEETATPGIASLVNKTVRITDDTSGETMEMAPASPVEMNQETASDNGHYIYFIKGPSQPSEIYNNGTGPVVSAFDPHWHRAIPLPGGVRPQLNSQEEWPIQVAFGRVTIRRYHRNFFGDPCYLAEINLSILFEDQLESLGGVQPDVPPHIVDFASAPTGDPVDDLYSNLSRLGIRISGLQFAEGNVPVKELMEYAAEDNAFSISAVRIADDGGIAVQEPISGMTARSKGGTGDIWVERASANGIRVRRLLITGTVFLRDKPDWAW